jgi:hypothetical protein
VEDALPRGREARAGAARDSDRHRDPVDRKYCPQNGRPIPPRQEVLRSLRRRLPPSRTPGPPEVV